MDEDLIIQACYEQLFGMFAGGVIAAAPIAFHNAEGWAREAEEKLTEELKQAKIGDKFFDFLVVDVNGVNDTITIRVEVKEAKIGKLPTFGFSGWLDIIITRNVNLTHLSPPEKYPVEYKGDSGFGVQIHYSMAPKPDIRLGFSRIYDGSNESSIYFVDATFGFPPIHFTGTFGHSAYGGLLLELEGRSDGYIPLGTTGFGLFGLGILYGRNFAPRIDEVPEKLVMARLETATALDYIKWLKSPKTAKRWAAVSENLDSFGLSATLGDIPSGGGLVTLRSLGVAFISYGPTVMFHGDMQVLKAVEAGSMVGGIDFKSQSMAARVTNNFGIIPYAGDLFMVDGTLELSASLKDKSKTFAAIGNYAMDGCHVSMLGWVDASGGARIVFDRGVALRAKAKVEAKMGGDDASVSAGLWFDMEGELGWNPGNVRGTLKAGGSFIIKVKSAKIGLVASADVGLSFGKPYLLRLVFDFVISLIFIDVPIHWVVVDKKEEKPGNPVPTLKATSADPLAFVHPPSGILGQLDDKLNRVWPDTMFTINFMRAAGGSGIVLNPQSRHRIEAGIDVEHSFSDLKIERKDPITGAWVNVPDVRASWLYTAAGDGVTPTSRLAIPCNDPLGWLNRFDYAQPRSTDRIPRFRLQSFGVGTARYYAPPTPGPGEASAEFEDVVIASNSGFWLLQAPWANSYARVLDLSRFTLDFINGPAGARTSTDTLDCELRVLAPRRAPPQISVQNAKVGPSVIVRQVSDRMMEWSIALTRDDAKQPIMIGSETPILLAAIGWWATEQIEHAPPDLSVLGPGFYRLTVGGDSSASFRTIAADQAAHWGLVREFEVIAPPLRPYLRYATLGDERLFGLYAGRWNPNPVGVGFGHYNEHLARIRAKVGYLDQIYQSVFVSVADREPLLTVPVVPCPQGTIAGSKASADWRAETGLPSAIERELTFEVSLANKNDATKPNPPVAGNYKISVFRGPPDANGQLTLIDTWDYRVSFYPSPAKHLALPYQLNKAIGPVSNAQIPAHIADALADPYDFDAVPKAKGDSDWLLPPMIADLRGPDDPGAGLSFMQLLEWCGIFHRPLGPIEEGPFGRPAQPDINIILDRAKAPVALLIRTAEPCDWRRVTIGAVTDYAKIRARAFGTKLIPSPDGCQCLVLLTVNGLPVRIANEHIALRIRFDLEAEGLPQLTRKVLKPDVPVTFDEMITCFYQPEGFSWWEK
jgi:hypothetical protein